MLKRITLGLLFTTTMISPVYAAEIGAALVALTAVIGQNLVAAGVTSFTVLSSIGSVVTFAANAIFSLALSFAVNAVFAPDAPRVPPSQTTGNFTQAEPPRFLVGGRQRKGGNVSFANTLNGTIYKQIAHSDTELVEHFDYYMNDVRVEYFDGTDTISNPEFGFNGAYFYSLSHRTGAPGQVAQSDLVSNFDEWTANHVGAGIADGLMVVGAMPDSSKASFRRYRGALGLGEPDLDVAGRWGRYYDPRNPAQDKDDDTTWGPNLGNPILFAAWHRTHPERFAMDVDDVDWDDIAQQADICDALITDRNGQSAVRYECGLAINKQQEANLATETRILSTCDGIVIEQPDGRLSFRAGYYEEPTITLYDEDIFDLASEEQNAGDETPTHFFASYTEPALGYVEASSSEWVAPGWQVGDKINKVQAPLYGCLNHRQAVALLKAAGSRQLETRNLKLVTNLKALQLRSERFVRLDLPEADWAGVYEIASITDNSDGMTCSLAVIKTDPDRWLLADGEEGEGPDLTAAVGEDNDVANIDDADMLIQATSVAGSNGTATASLLATFTPPTRADATVQIQYRRKPDVSDLTPGTYQEMDVNTAEGVGISGVVADGLIYETRWQTKLSTGFVSGFSAVREVTATADQTAPADLTAVSVTGGVGQVTIEYTTSNSPNFGFARIYRSNIDPADFADATALEPEYGPPNTAETYVETGLAADDYHFWIEPVNGSGVAGTRAGPFTVTIT